MAGAGCSAQRLFSEGPARDVRFHRSHHTKRHRVPLWFRFWGIIFKVFLAACNGRGALSFQ